MYRGAAHMKKYRLGAVGSYYQYQLKKLKQRQSQVLFWIALLLVGVFLVTGRFESDLNEILTVIGGGRPEPIEQDVYLIQPVIDYSIYAAPKNAKGIYIPETKISHYEDYIKLARETDVNSFVIDVKDDQGYLTFASNNKTLISKGMVLANPPIKDIDHMMDRLCEAKIYPIARIVAFKDDVAARHDPSLAVKNRQGNSYVTSANDTWLNPYNKENWDYLLEVSKEAVKMGFKEIQFDYVRFHESMSAEKVELDDETSKKEIITEFIKYICEHLHEEGVKVSADVFGAVVISDVDTEIVGQDFGEMSRYLDYICPMIYPSHYAEGTFGIEHPHMDVYEIINKTLKIGLNKTTSSNGEKRAVIRPWLQDFTLKSAKPYLEYGPEQIKGQIQGAADAGVNEWLFWNAAGNYTKDGMKAE